MTLKDFLEKRLEAYLVLLTGSPDSEICGGHRLDFRDFGGVKRHSLLRIILQEFQNVTIAN